MQRIIEEKNRQISLMRQGDQERVQIENSLKQMFENERRTVGKEMESFLESFKKQS